MSAPKRPASSYVLLCLAVAACAALAKFIWPGKAYYLLSASQRPMHSYHALLRSSGPGGLTFGLLGTLLIFLNLTYLIRGRLGHIEWLGSLRSWMSFHVFTGLLGTLLILFHGAFLLRSPLASIALLALLVTSVTGLVGRYIYAHTPRSVQGKELELAEIQRNLGAYRADLQKLGLAMDLFEGALPALRPGGSAGGFAALLAFFAASDRLQSAEYRKLRDAVFASPELRPAAAQILSLGRRYFKERRWLDHYQELRSLMGSWRFFHRWFAIVMLIIAGFHILVAVSMGELRLPGLLR